MKTAVSETEVSSGDGNVKVVAVTAAVEARGDARAEIATQMMRLLRDTRQQIGELRQRTESALAFVRQVNTDRRRELEEIQTAKAQLSLLYSQFADAVAASKETAASKQRLRDESGPPPSTDAASVCSKPVDTDATP